MDAVIERLRKSKDQFTNAESVSGHTVGRDWAMRRASYRELERFAAWVWHEEDVESNGWAWRAFAEISEEDPPSARDAEEFWSRLCDQGSPSDTFVQSFIEGAEEVYRE